MKRWVRIALFALFWFAVLVRLLPLTWSLYWGADTGEYYALTRQVYDGGAIPHDYAGWGVTYPFFPGAYFVSASLALAGLPPVVALIVAIPLLAALSVVGAYLIAVRFYGDDRVGLLAGAIVAVAMPHLYATSHPMPGALADPLMVFSLLMFLRLRESPRWAPPFLLCGLAVVVTHHLTTYFLLLAALAVLMLPVVLRRRTPPRDIAWQSASLAALVVASFAYWTLYATRFRTDILSAVRAIPWWALMAAFVLAVLLVPLAAALRPRVRWRYLPRWPSRARSLVLFAAASAAATLIVALAVVSGVPGTSIALPPLIVPVALPLILLLSLAAAGGRRSTFHRDGVAPTAWFAAITGSVVVGALFASTVLVPYRHTQYLLLPLSLLAALGAVALLDATKGRARLPLAVGLALLLAGATVTAYPPQALMSGYDEAVNPRAMSPVSWASDRAQGLALSDHMVSTLLFGFGDVNATWDDAPGGLTAGSFEEARPELEAVDAPSGVGPVTYAVMTRGVERGAMFNPWDPAEALSPEAVAKFDSLPFQRLYDDGYGRVYVLHWSLVEG